MQATGTKLKSKRNEASWLEITECLARTGSWHIDFRKNSVEWSDGVYGLLGYTREEFGLTMDNAFSIVHPDDLERATTQFKRCLDEDVPYQIDKRFVTKKGDVLHVHSRAHIERDSHGNPLRMIGVFQDITDRIRTEENLRHSNERFEIISRATNDAIWDFDLITDHLYWGHGFKTLFGHDPDVVKPSFDLLISLIHSDDRQRVLDKIRAFLEGRSGTNHWVEEYRFKKADGNYAWVTDKAIFVRDENGNTTRVLGAMSDLTHRKEHEESLRKLNLELEKNVRDLAKSNSNLEQFAYVTSHDLQEPLRMIYSFMQQLEKRYGDQLDEKAHQYIHFAIDGAKRMRQIILDLLEYSRVGQHEDFLSEINISDLVHEVCALNRKIIEERDAQIQIDNLPVIKSYRTPLIQIFQNLIDNAVRFGREGVKPVVRISSKQLSDAWSFSVADNGSGIPEKQQEKVYDVFQRLHRDASNTGTGLGLSIVRKTVEGLGGNICMESEVNKGTTFHFTLPNV